MLLKGEPHLFGLQAFFLSRELMPLILAQGRCAHPPVQLVDRGGKGPCRGLVLSEQPLFFFARHSSTVAFGPTRQ